MPILANGQGVTGAKSNSASVAPVSCWPSEEAFLSPSHFATRNGNEDKDNGRKIAHDLAYFCSAGAARGITLCRASAKFSATLGQLYFSCTRALAEVPSRLRWFGSRSREIREPAKLSGVSASRSFSPGGT